MEPRPIIGDSPRMQQVRDQVARLGRYDWPILVLGETGTGKEVVARSLYEVRSQGPFVVVDCSAIPHNLLESELFGHTRGAFTGAMAPKTGLLERAHGGVAFFDEIGELPLEMQSKLLRALQEKEIRPVGSLIAKRTDFRVIAATNRDLRREIEQRRFRADLFFRLNVVSLRLPALRDRASDIAALAEHFVHRYGRGHQIGQGLLAKLAEYPWPGNVRELENCVKHMLTVNSGPWLTEADLPSAVQNYFLQRSGIALGAAVGGGTQTTLEFAPPPIRPQSSRTLGGGIQTLAMVERRAILEALEYTKGDRTAAAELLGIGRTTLYRKLKEYGARDFPVAV
jgi:DNA-binding NtrC family response regulator